MRAFCASFPTSIGREASATKAKFRNSQPLHKPPGRPITGAGVSTGYRRPLRLAEVGMALGIDPGAKLLERARRPGRAQPRHVTPRACGRVAQLLDGAAEELAGGLELRPKAEETELLVPGDVHPGTELVEEQEEPLAGRAWERFEPGLEAQGGGLLHDTHYPRA